MLAISYLEFGFEFGFTSAGASYLRLLVSSAYLGIYVSSWLSREAAGQLGKLVTLGSERVNLLRCPLDLTGGGIRVS